MLAGDNPVSWMQNFIQNYNVCFQLPKIMFLIATMHILVMDNVKSALDIQCLVNRKCFWQLKTIFWWISTCLQLLPTQCAVFSRNVEITLGPDPSWYGSTLFSNIILWYGLISLNTKVHSFENSKMAEQCRSQSDCSLILVLKSFTMPRCPNTYTDPEGVQGVPPPPNHKNIWFLSNTGTDPQKIAKLPSQNSMLGHHRHSVSLVSR